MFHIKRKIIGFLTLLLGVLVVVPIAKAQLMEFFEIAQQSIPPSIKLIEGVESPTFDQTPEVIISSTKAGQVYFKGACSSSELEIISGENIIIFDELEVGTYSDCQIWVVDGDANQSNILNIPEFTIDVGLIVQPPKDLVAPYIKLIRPIPDLVETATPEFTFETSEAGEIIYEGSCLSNERNAVEGENVITLNPLSAGTYNNCKIKVRDEGGNESNLVDIPRFTVDVESEYCADFVDLKLDDPDCEAFKFVKSQGVMTGNPDGSFRPERILQRDQIAKVVLEFWEYYEAGEDYCQGEPAFSDVGEDQWSYQYICRGVEMGLIGGYEAGEDAGLYRPGRSVNRAEFLKLLLSQAEFSSHMSETNYSDVSPDDWFFNVAKYSYDFNLFEGKELNPGREVTRREVAQVLFKVSQISN